MYVFADFDILLPKCTTTLSESDICFCRMGGGGYFMDINAIRIFLYIIKCMYFKKLPLRTIDILKNIDDNIKSLMNKNIILVTLQNSWIYHKSTTLIIFIHVNACGVFFYAKYVKNLVDMITDYSNLITLNVIYTV